MSVNDMGFAAQVEYKTLAEGDYDAIIHGVVGLGLNPVEFQGEQKAPAVFIKIIYEIPSEVRGDGLSTVIGQKLKLSGNDKSNCYKFLTTLFGTAINKNTAVGYLNSAGLQNLLGKTLSITINHFNKDGKDIAYVGGTTKLDPRLPQPVATREAFFFNPLLPDLNVFKNTITYSTQEQIMGALNAKQFPRELHEEWVSIQENKAAKDSATRAPHAPSRNATLGSGNTESIE